MRSQVHRLQVSFLKELVTGFLKRKDFKFHAS